MKLVDLHPRWLDAGGEGVTRFGQPVPEREGIGILFDCPCGCGEHVGVYFDPPLDGQPVDPYYATTTWKRTGDTFETITLEPSIQRVGGCAWHGYLRNGELVRC